jgi:hypothetical protein
MSPIRRRASQALLALCATGLLAVAARASDAPVRDVRCYGLTPPEATAPAQDAATAAAASEADKAATPKQSRKKKKDYIVMRANDCAMAGGRLGGPK